MSSGRSSERKQDDLFTHRLSPESSDICLDDGGRSPGFPHCWRLPVFRENSGDGGQQQDNGFTVAGTAPDYALRQHRYSLLIFR